MTISSGRRPSGRRVRVSFLSPAGVIREWNTVGESGDSAGHVDGATHRRLDLAVAIGALGDLYGRSVITLDRVVHERGIARAARCVDGHSAGRAFVGGHDRTIVDPRPGKCPGAPPTADALSRSPVEKMLPAFAEIAERAIWSAVARVDS